MQQSRKDTKEVLQELREACRRSLFEEIVGRGEAPDPNDGTSSQHDRQTTADSTTGRPMKRPKRASDGSKSRTRSWEELLAEAARLLPFMTSQEHGTVTRIAAILFFGFLVPTSTGNDFFKLQHQQTTTRRRGRDQKKGEHSSEASSSSRSLETFIDMSLEERLEHCARFYAAGEFGEMDCCMDPVNEKAFRLFLHNGIAPLLASRPAHPTETDLLHLIAMTISPQPDKNLIDCKTRDEKDPPSWSCTKRLLNSIYPSSSFQVSYSHRLALVKLVTQNLVLPELDTSKSQTAFDDPLLDGAIPHLRVALHAFAIGAAQSKMDSHWARCALVHVAVCSGDELTVAEEWDSLMNVVTHNLGPCPCKSLFGNESNKCDLQSLMDNASTTDPFCEYSARGVLLEAFILRFNESRHYADGAFVEGALCSLSDFVLSQVRLLMTDEATDKPMAAPNCLLASILLAARSLFYFVLPEQPEETPKQQDESSSKSEERRAKETLLGNAIQLLHHSDAGVSRAASSLLALAFAYNPKQVSHCQQAVANSIQMAWDEFFQSDASKQHESVMTSQFLSTQDVITTLSRLSPSFASNIMEYVLEKIQGDKQQNDARSVAAFRMLATIATARPFTAQKRCKTLVSLAKRPLDDVCKRYLADAILALRQAHFFEKDIAEDSRTITTELVTSVSDPWIKYKLACHAMTSGNFRVAHQLFPSILSSTSSEASYLWLSALAQVAGAEGELASKGCRGILSATPMFQSGLSYLESLARMSPGTTTSTQKFRFQIECLQLRIDFLDLCVSLHNLCREIRLSGAVPKGNTRSELHLRNTLKLLYSLATRYFMLYRRYGLFVCQQSRTALRTCYATCQWLGDAGRKAFPEATKSEKDDDSGRSPPNGDCLHPLTLLRTKLNHVVLDTLDGSLEAQIRGAAMAEALDAVLMTPYPIPRGFTVVKTVPYASLSLSIDADTLESDGSGDDATHDVVHDEQGVMDVFPGTTCTLIASGEIPPSTIRSAKVYFSDVLLSCAVRFLCLLEDETLIEGNTAAQASSAAGSPDGALPTVTPLLPHGKFLASMQCQAPAEEGLYAVDVTLGCRDVRCGEWELPVSPNARPLVLRVSRSRE